MCRIGVLFLMIFMVCFSVNASPPPIRGTQTPDYDYSQTRSIILYGEDDYVYLSNPFEHAAPSMGALVYEIVLLYVPHLQPLAMPPDQPTHVVDLMMKDSIGQWRLGQRLYVGNPWIADGKSVALMKPVDYQLLNELLTKRYKFGTRYEIDQTKTLKRVQKNLRPDDWLAQDQSAQEAIRRMPASDYQREGYDPGAQVRRRWDDNSGGAGKQVLSDSASSVAVSETRIAPDVATENVTPVITQAEPSNPAQKTEFKLSSSNPELKPENGKILLVGFVLAGFLLLSLMFRRKKIQYDLPK